MLVLFSVSAVFILDVIFLLVGHADCCTRMASSVRVFVSVFSLVFGTFIGDMHRIFNKYRSMVGIEVVLRLNMN